MRFKELRGVLFSTLLLILDLSLFIYNIVFFNKTKIIIAVALSFFILLSLINQFYIRIMKDCILLYKFAGIILLPEIVDYKDITELKIVNKHHLTFIAKGKNHHIYIFDSHKVFEALNNAISENNER